MWFFCSASKHFLLGTGGGWLGVGGAKPHDSAHMWKTVQFFFSPCLCGMARNTLPRSPDRQADLIKVRFFYLPLTSTWTESGFIRKTPLVSPWRPKVNTPATDELERYRICQRFHSRRTHSCDVKLNRVDGINLVFFFLFEYFLWMQRGVWFSAG